jgi:glycine/D-amino acid oxidase-like deaminating enzyme
MQVDFIIVGQGLAGTFLHYYLTQKGYKAIIIDNPQPFSASKVASGVINPVTGRRLSTTWMIDTIMPFAVDAYQAIANFIGIEKVVAQKNIVNFFPTPQMQLAFEERLPHVPYIKLEQNSTLWQTYFSFPFSIGIIEPSYWVNVHALLTGYHQYLQQNQLILHDIVDEAAITHTSTSVQYNDVQAKKMFFCNGVKNTNSQYFGLLPYAKNKGEAIIAKIPNLPTTNLYKMGLTLVPWQQDTWWIGSTYEWEFENTKPTEAFRNKVDIALQNWLKLPYTIIDHLAAERPANLERRPFVGLHPVYKHIGILNGLGTKGCSLAPYFAHQLANYLHDNSPIEPAANVQRFQKILSR